MQAMSKFDKSQALIRRVGRVSKALVEAMRALVKYQCKSRAWVNNKKSAFV